MIKLYVPILLTVVTGTMLITSTTAAYACMSDQLNRPLTFQRKDSFPPAMSTSSSSGNTTSMFLQSNNTKPKLTNSNATTTVSPSTIHKQGTERSLPTSLILVNLRMPAKNTTDYGIVDLTVTLNNATKIRSFNTTSSTGDNIVMPFRFSPKSDKIDIKVGDKFTSCASGEFLAAAVCHSDTIKTKNPPITRTHIELG